MKQHSRRERSTGPRHALVVVKCLFHGEFFTLYPSGYEPYGREILVPRRGVHWRDTYFRAAEAAAAGEPAWPREFDGGPGWWTQRRHIHRAADRLGLICPARCAEKVADALEVGMQVQARARHLFSVARGFRSRAKAVVMVLDAVPLDGMVLERVLSAGHLSGTSSQPWIWTAQGYVTPFH